jgi:hypothetical protein
LTRIIKIWLVAFYVFFSELVFSQDQEVILIRHAKVNIEVSGWMGPKKAAQLRKLYDTSPIYPFVPGSVLEKLPELKTDTVYVSSLCRSVSTGWMLFGDSAIILSSPFFDEFDLHIVRLPFILPYKGWTGISRALWLLGANQKHNESHREAKRRVKQIADFIELRLQYNKQVILVTHGFLNRNVARELKKRNWQQVADNGGKNLGTTLLRK